MVLPSDFPLNKVGTSNHTRHKATKGSRKEKFDTSTNTEVRYRVVKIVPANYDVFPALMRDRLGAEARNTAADTVILRRVVHLDAGIKR